MYSFLNPNKNTRNSAILFFLLLSFSTGLTNIASGQHWGYVVFKDKGLHDNSFQNNFTPAAIERRFIQNIEWDERDVPVSEEYISLVEAYSDSTFGTSRWLNAAVVRATENNWNFISNLPCVQEIEWLKEQSLLSAEFPVTLYDSSSVPADETTEAQKQLDLLEPKQFSERELFGKNTIIAIFDAGFTGAENVDQLSHLFKNNQIAATKDFLKKTEQVYSHSIHGTEVLTFLAGKNDSVQFGLATEATYLLARVTPNMGFFRFLNDVQWIQALEWADEKGASLVNSSLSFTNQLYERRDLNGRTCKISIAANTAMAKGILVINAAGNEFQNSWEIIGAPADAERILTVGSVNPTTGYISSFSSIGPTSDGRLKPDVCAPGELLYPEDDGDDNYKSIQGTSFATPLVCGFAACVRQLHPDWTTEKLWEEIRKSGSLYPFFDYAHGFGIPKASYFFFGEEEKPNVYLVQFALDSLSCNNILTISRRDTIEIEENFSSPVAFIQFIKATGEVFKYNVSRPQNKVIASIPAEEFKGCKLRVVYDRHFFEIPIPQP
jgi:subtilisin family serine protease